MDPITSLTERSNASLGEALLQLKLVDQEMIDESNRMFQEFMNQGDFKRASLLKILTWDLNFIEETQVLNYQVEEFGLGYLNINHYDLERDSLPPFKLAECWATMSLPLDFLEGTFFVATASYLSKDVIAHWEKRLSPSIVWYVSDLSSLTMTLERLEKEDEKQKEAAEREESEGDAGEDVEEEAAPNVEEIPE